MEQRGQHRLGVKVLHRALIASTFLGAACRPAGSANNWDLETPDSLGWYVARESPDICLDCISIEEVARVGDFDGPGYLMESQFVGRTKDGNVWVGQPGGPKVFDGDGQFIAQVGRPGEGPGEFQSPTILFVDNDDRVHLFDTSNKRETIIGSDLAIRNLHVLPGFAARAVPRADGGYVANMAVMTAERVGLPMHVVDSSGIVVASFGQPCSGSGPIMVEKRIASGPDGRIFAADIAEYSVEVWSGDGERLGGFKREGLWEPPLDSLPRPLTKANPVLNPSVMALDADSGGNLWVVAWLPKEDWIKDTEEVLYGSGLMGLRPKAGAFLFKAVVEVIDLKTGLVVARSEFPEGIGGSLGGGLFHGPRTSGDGAPQVAILQLNLRRR